jgi:hypothetical protein
LMAETPFSFGGEHRYYGSRTAPDPAADCSGATGEIAALLKEYDPELERRVSRSFRQWNNVRAATCPRCVRRSRTSTASGNKPNGPADTSIWSIRADVSS